MPDSDENGVWLLYPLRMVPAFYFILFLFFFKNALSCISCLRDSLIMTVNG